MESIGGLGVCGWKFQVQIPPIELAASVSVLEHGAIRSLFGGLGYELRTQTRKGAEHVFVDITVRDGGVGSNKLEVAKQQITLLGRVFNSDVCYSVKAAS